MNKSEGKKKFSQFSPTELLNWEGKSYAHSILRGMQLYPDTIRDYEKKFDKVMAIDISTEAYKKHLSTKLQITTEEAEKIIQSITKNREEIKKEMGEIDFYPTLPEIAFTIGMQYALGNPRS